MLLNSCGVQIVVGHRQLLVCREESWNHLRRRRRHRRVHRRQAWLRVNWRGELRWSLISRARLGRWGSETVDARSCRANGIRSQTCRWESWRIAKQNRSWSRRSSNGRLNRLNRFFWLITFDVGQTAKKLVQILSIEEVVQIVRHHRGRRGRVFRDGSTFDRSVSGRSVAEKNWTSRFWSFEKRVSSDSLLSCLCRRLPVWSRCRWRHRRPNSEDGTESRVVEKFRHVCFTLLRRIAGLVDEILQNADHVRILQDGGLARLALHLRRQQNHQRCLGIRVQSRGRRDDGRWNRLNSRMLLLLHGGWLSWWRWLRFPGFGSATVFFIFSVGRRRRRKHRLTRWKTSYLLLDNVLQIFSD